MKGNKIRFFFIVIILIINYELFGLEISLIAPEDKLITYEKETSCRGRLSEPSYILINRKYRIYGEVFDIKVPLNIGKNSILIEIYNDNQKYTFVMRILRLNSFRDLNKSNYIIKKSIENVASVFPELNFENFIFKPDSMVTMNELKKITLLSFGVSLNYNFEKQYADFKDIVYTINSLYVINPYHDYLVYKNVSASAENNSYSKEPLVQGEGAQDPYSNELNRWMTMNILACKKFGADFNNTLTRKAFFVFLSRLDFIKTKIYDLFSWETYFKQEQKDKEFCKVKVLEKKIIPKIAPNDGKTPFLINIKLDHDIFVESVIMDFSSIGWDANKVVLSKEDDYYQTKGIVAECLSPGVKKIPFLIKLLNGNYLFEEVTLWVKNK